MIEVKKSNKIRKMLRDEYHLYEEYPSGKWALYKKYSNPAIFFSEYNVAIMTSEENTEEELYKFAKTHKRYDLVLVSNNIFFVANIFNLCMLIINSLFIKSSALSCISLGISLGLCLSVISLFLIQGHNFEIDMLNIREEIKRWKSQEKN